MLFPETERSVMDLILTNGESSAFDPLDLNRFQTETRGLASVQIAREKEEQRQRMLKRTLSLIPVVAVVGYLVLKK
tara:strand:+ start:268 stop:495 length:228 start_codon:yes stop_codon:yes gene_type:complete